LFSEKQDSLALSYYNNALRIKPDSYDALYGKAIFYQNTGNIRQAEKTYRYILDNISESLPEIYFNLGYINMIDLEKYQVAISKFDSALMIKPDYFQAIYNKAFCYEQLKNYQKAKQFYNQILTIYPDYNLAKKGLDRINKN
jgi:tetratricopeptide (TPR) repeat protein